MILLDSRVTSSSKIDGTRRGLRFLSSYPRNRQCIANQYNPNDSELMEKIAGFLLCLSVSLFWWSFSGIEDGPYSRYFVEDSAYVRS